jgi:plasmid stabilization system protein ParE
MTYRVEVTAQAEAEMDEAYQWIADRSPARATRWYRGLRTAIESLADYPRRCALAPESEYLEDEIRQLLYGRRSGIYRVLFQIHDAAQVVFVLHVRHGARQYLHLEERASADDE